MLECWIDLLLGPTHAIHKILKQSGMSLEDFDVVEIHEAFAGQVRVALTPDGFLQATA